MSYALLDHTPHRLHTAILVGPPSHLADRIASALRGSGLTILRTARIDADTCAALGGVTGCVAVVIAQTSENAHECCDVPDNGMSMPLLRVVGGRLMSVTYPDAESASLAAALAGAGVSLSDRMTGALSVPA